MAIRNVGVLGCGLMGSGIVQVAAQAGFPTVVVEATQELLDRGLCGLPKSLDAMVSKARIDDKTPDEIKFRIKGVVGQESNLECDL